MKPIGTKRAKEFDSFVHGRAIEKRRTRRELENESGERLADTHDLNGKLKKPGLSEGER